MRVSSQLLNHLMTLLWIDQVKKSKKKNRGKNTTTKSMLWARLTLTYLGGVLLSLLSHFHVITVKVGPLKLLAPASSLRSDLDPPTLD